jgi:hypothetical protein
MEMEPNQISDSRWLKALWQGQAQARPGIVTLAWAVVRLFLSGWLWGTAVRLAYFPPPTKTAGLVLALISIFLFLWALWGIGQTIRLLGLKRLAVTIVLAFLVMVTINVLTIANDRPFVDRAWAQTGTVVRQINSGLLSWKDSLANAPDEFLFAYSGQRSAPELPPGFPTPDPQATPVQAFARPGSD